MKSIVLIFPYFGKLPAQYGMWRASALRNPTVDFMFFTDADVEPAKNIIVHKMQFHDFREYIQGVLEFPIVLDRPYILCDFKPVYGEALQKYISHYDVWGYGDLDVVYGDIRAFLTDELLSKYKYFLGYGHLTLYRNDQDTNSYYKEIVPGYQTIERLYLFISRHFLTSMTIKVPLTNGVTAAPMTVGWKSLLTMPLSPNSPIISIVLQEDGNRSFSSILTINCICYGSTTGHWKNESHSMPISSIGDL